MPDPPPAEIPPTPFEGWDAERVYNDVLTHEAFAIHAGDNITPNAGHVRRAVDMVLNMSAKSDELTTLVFALVEKVSDKLVARRFRKRWNMTSDAAQAPTRQD